MIGGWELLLLLLLLFSVVVAATDDDEYDGMHASPETGKLNPYPVPFTVSFSSLKGHGYLGRKKYG